MNKVTKDQLSPALRAQLEEKLKANAGLRFGGAFIVGIRNKETGVIRDETVELNMVVAQGRQHVLDTVFDSGTQVTEWYVGIFEGNYTVLDTVTAATVAGAATECTAYDESTRPVYDTASPIEDDTATNADARATFTFNATKTVYGAFIISDDAKGGTDGVLLAISRFTTPKSMAAPEELVVSYLFTVADA